MKDVVLVSMPFASVAHPAIGISSIKAVLESRGINCEIQYLNLKFAAKIGFHCYNTFGELAPPTSLVGDWIFKDCLFGENIDLSNAYVEDILMGDYVNYFSPPIIFESFFVKEEAECFIDECLKSFPWSDYKIIGFTTSFQQNCASLSLAKRIKDQYPEKVIVFGGANCEGEMGKGLHRAFPFIDHICSGEGENSFPALVEMILGKKPINKIDGIISRSNVKSVYPDKIVSPVNNLNDLPWPKYDEYFSQLNESNIDFDFSPLVPIETSRGCWYGERHHCTFCGLNGSTMTFRSKEPKKALDEVMFLYEKYKKDFLVVDNILDNKYFSTFIPDLAKQKLDASFHYEVKANLRKSQIKLLSQAGIDHLQPGIESFSNSILRLMDKGTTLRQNIQTMKWCKEFGIQVAWNLLYGFPGEHEEEYQEMQLLLPLLTHLDPPTGCGQVRVDRHSPYFINFEKYGIKNIHVKKAYDLIYPLPEKDVFDIAYYFDFDFDFHVEPNVYAHDIKNIVEYWKQNNSRSSLSIYRHERKNFILDSRFGRTRKLELSEVEFQIYILCDNSKSLNSIESELKIDFPHITKIEIEAILDRFISKKLMIRDDIYFLSLAVFDTTIYDYENEEKPLAICTNTQADL